MHIFYGFPRPYSLMAAAGLIALSSSISLAQDTRLSTTVPGAQGFNTSSEPGKAVSTRVVQRSAAAANPSFTMPAPQGTEIPLDELEQRKKLIETGPLAPAEVPTGIPDASREAAAVSVSPEAPIPVTSFQGYAYTGWIPPDPIMAAGPSDLIVAVNSSWRIYNKAGGQLFDTTFVNWFANVLPTDRTNISVFDPWVLYDQPSDRFVLLALAKRDSDQLSRFLIAVSDDNTAAGGWCNYWLDARLNGSAITSNWADYTKVGTTGNAVVLSANMFNFADEFQYAKLRFLSKSQLYNTACPSLSWWDFWDLRNADNSRAFTIQPALSYFASSASYGINSYSGGGNQLTLWQYTTPATIPPAPTLARQATLTTAGYTLAPNAEQRGSTTRIHSGDARLLNAVYRASGLWTTHTVGCSWSGDTANRSCIRYYAINPGASAITQQATYGAARLHYYYPAITADALGNATVVFSRSGPDEFAGARYTGRRSTEPLNTLQGSASLRAGDGCYVRLDTSGRNRWGDYNGISVDPVNSFRTWIFSEYVAGTSTDCGSNVWGTRVGLVSW